MLCKAAVEELAVRSAKPGGRQAARGRRPEGGANGFFSALRARDFARPIKTVKHGGPDGRSFRTAIVGILRVQRQNSIIFDLSTDYGTTRKTNTNQTNKRGHFYFAFKGDILTLP